jgi:hypothetical protein
LLAQQNPAENKERRKQVKMVIGFVPGDLLMNLPLDYQSLRSEMQSTSTS